MKAKRKTLGKIIESAGSIDEMLQLCYMGGKKPTTDAEGVALAWCSWNKFYATAPISDDQRTAHRKFIDNGTFNFIIEAMTAWRPDKLRELANEMTKLENWKMDVARWLLLMAGKQGVVNVTHLYNHAIDHGMIDMDLRTFQEIAARLPIKVREPGFPNSCAE